MPGREELALGLEPPTKQPAYVKLVETSKYQFMIDAWPYCSVRGSVSIELKKVPPCIYGIVFAVIKLYSVVAESGSLHLRCDSGNTIHPSHTLGI